jgi:hypothetical protein
VSGRILTAEEAQALLGGTTPGPWVLWEGHTKVFAGAITENTTGTLAGGQEVCEVEQDRLNDHDPEIIDGSDPDDDPADIPECGGCGDYSCELCYPAVFADARLVAAAPDLAATVASEPARIAAAVAAERAAIVAAVEEMAATWGALTPKQQDLVSAFADHVVNTLAARSTP